MASTPSLLPVNPKPNLILIEAVELDLLVSYSKKCKDVLMLSIKRVDQLEAYKIEADKQLGLTTQLLVAEQSKPKLNLLYLVPPFVLGLVLGVVVLR